MLLRAFFRYLEQTRTTTSYCSTCGMDKISSVSIDLSHISLTVFAAGAVLNQKYTLLFLSKIIVT